MAWTDDVLVAGQLAPPCATTNDMLMRQSPDADATTNVRRPCVWLGAGAPQLEARPFARQMWPRLHACFRRHGLAAAAQPDVARCWQLCSAFAISPTGGRTSLVMVLAAGVRSGRCEQYSRAVCL